MLATGKEHERKVHSTLCPTYSDFVLQMFSGYHGNLWISLCKWGIGNLLLF
jgi:hypothetical protein